MDIPVLFCHARSNYKKVPGFDVYDLKRDALNYTGSSPAILHPPCRRSEERRVGKECRL